MRAAVSESSKSGVRSGVSSRRVSLLAFMLPGLALVAAMPLGGQAAPPQTPARPPQGAVAGTAGAGQPSTSQAGRAGQRSGDPNTRPGHRPDWLWWQDDAVRKEMALTDLQVRQIDRLYQQREKDMKPFIANLDTENDALDKMAQEMTASPEEFRLQVSKVQSLLGEVVTSRTVMLYRINLLLTPAQRTKLKDVSERHFKGRGGGPGR